MVSLQSSEGFVMECKGLVGSSGPVMFGLLLLIFCDYSSAGGFIRRDDICGPYSGKRLYLELGEHGVLSARNLSSPAVLQIQRSPTSLTQNSSHEQCSLNLITCPSCVISITFYHLNLSHRCGGENVAMDSPCRCDYVWVSEPPHEDKSGVPFCGILNTPQVTSPSVPLMYRSLTRTVAIMLLFSESHQHAFTLEYSAEHNRQFLKGSQSTGSLHSNESQGGILLSPFFPVLYPRDLGVEYVINCNMDPSTHCRVRIIFRDFQLSTLSIMEFYDWNGQRIAFSTGDMFRPPVILSSGPSLMIRFYANGGTGLGYKAIYSFIAYSLKDETIKPETDCGGYVENLGGAITMMNMVDKGVKTYDCIWLIRPRKNFLHHTHLYLKVASFLDMADSTDLQVLQGLTSDQPVLEVIRQPVAQMHLSRTKEHIIPADVGFYISLKGTFSSQSRLAIVYATFSYKDCFTRSDFLCKNHRCIPIQLNCDGFDHCGDNSDEPATCVQDWKEQPQDKRWYAHIPNYYFPKMERYPDLKTATMVFIASSLGLVLLISALIVLLYHMGARARQQRELQSRLQTISDLLADGAHNNGDSPPDEPPMYEAPPDYDEIIKVFSEPVVPVGRKKKRQQSTNRRSHSSPAAIHSKSRNKKATSVPVLSLGPASSPSIISRSCQTTPIPDTPPPPYMPPSIQESSCSHLTTKRSEHGARARESWLLFKDNSSSVEEHLTITQQLNNIPSTTNSPACNIKNQTASIDMNMNNKSCSASEDGECIDNLMIYPTEINNDIFNSTSFDTNLSYLRNLSHEDQTHVDQFQQMSLSFDSLISRDYQSCPHNQVTPNISEELLCSCEGACGCASLTVDSQQHGRLSRSLSEGLPLTNPEGHLRALDIYFSHHEISSDHRLHF